MRKFLIMLAILVGFCVSSKAQISELNKETDDFTKVSFYTYPNFKYNFKVYIGENEKQTWLRVKLRYGGDDWIFFKGVYFYCDGETYYLDCSNVERDCNGYGVWEVTDILATDKTIMFLKKMSKGSDVRIRFIGKYYYDKELKPSVLNGIDIVLNAYDELKKKHNK